MVETELPLVTVVTNVRNGEAYLAEAIESIRAQTLDDWEYVIVDDASEDGTPSIIERYAHSDVRIRSVRRSESSGWPSAANAGIALARGRYIARLDADDVAMPHRLARQIRFLAENSDLRACASNVKVLRDGRTWPHRIGRLPTRPGSLKWRLCVRPGFMPSTTLIERSAFEEVGGFRESPIAEDHRLWCELARRRWLGVVPEELVYWRRHAGQISSRARVIQVEALTDVIREHLGELTSERWTDEDLRRLRFVGRRRMGFRTGLVVIRRFERMWRADATLTRVEQEELATLTRRLRVEHLWTLGRYVLARAPIGRLLAKSYRRRQTAAVAPRTTQASVERESDFW